MVAYIFVNIGSGYKNGYIIDTNLLFESVVT